MTADSPIASVDFERVELPLAREFTIARGTTSTATNHLVTVTDETGRTGVGAAAPAAYYDETPDSVESVLPELCAVAEAIESPFAQQRLERELLEAAPGEAAARAAVSVAVHDLAAKQRAEPLYQQWGLDPTLAPATSYTVGIDSPEEMAAQAAEIAEHGYPILKVKLGTDNDQERLEAVREAAPEVRIRVDANCAWSPDEAIENAAWLHSCDIEFLEQPVIADDTEGLQRVTQETPFPVAADESCVTAADVGTVADAVDIVVVKLMKCGGIRPALRQIEAAHAHGLSVMLGCMVESNAAIAGAAQLSPLVSYADLDGSLLLAEDPCSGFEFETATLKLANVTHGTGAVR